MVLTHIDSIKVFPSDRYWKPAHTYEISPSVRGLQVTHTVHGLMAMFIFATHLPICFRSDHSSLLFPSLLLVHFPGMDPSGKKKKKKTS